MATSSTDYVLIREIIEDKIDDDDVKNKIFELVYGYMERKKLEYQPPPITMVNGKFCLICKREYHIFSFYSHTGRELKCCSLCRSYQKKYRNALPKEKSPKEKTKKNLPKVIPEVIPDTVPEVILEVEN